MIKKPKVSVLMTVYNTIPNELQRAIESILQQTFGDFEFVIINDAATDNSEDIILSYKDKRIRYYKNEKNLKIIASANKGLSLCTGEYVARLDSDDYSDVTRLDKQVKFMEQNHDIGVCGTYFHRIATNEDVTDFPSDRNDIKLCMRYVKGCISNPSSMIRRSILVNNNIKYNPNCLHAEDHKLWVDLSYVTEMAVYPEVLTYISAHESGVSKTNAKYQAKMVRVITFDNIIKDFSQEKEYMYGILQKFIACVPISQEEFEYTKSFLSLVVSILENQISSPYNSWVRGSIMSLLNGFIVKMF